MKNKPYAGVKRLGPYGRHALEKIRKKRFNLARGERGGGLEYRLTRPESCCCRGGGEPERGELAGRAVIANLRGGTCLPSCDLGAEGAERC
jgi:hypothetical protein